MAEGGTYLLTIASNKHLNHTHSSRIQNLKMLNEWVDFLFVQLALRIFYHSTLRVSC